MRGKKNMVGSRGVLGFMLKMVEEMDDAKKLSDKELASEVLNKVWSRYPVNSIESAAVGEILDRFKKITGCDKKGKKCHGKRTK